MGLETLDKPIARSACSTPALNGTRRRGCRSERFAAKRSAAAMSPAPPLTPFPWFDVVIILLLVTLNGVFAMSELAIVSSRKPRLKAMAKAGRRGPTTAPDPAPDPGRFPHRNGDG